LTQDGRKEIELDPNRDFPYLTPKEECFKTITARSVNEIFINNLIKIFLSLHGGISNLTYAYGTPNHFTNIDNNLRITEELKRDENRLMKVINYYYDGKLDSFDDLETNNSPDQKILESNKTF